MAKILLVEDDNNLREIYEARLQAEGFSIVSAHDGEEALVVAKGERPDLIISDVMMPKISGFEMLDIIRATPTLANVKIIMLTALGQNEDQDRANKLGADRYLVKSQVTLEDIVNTANELLNQSSAPTLEQLNSDSTVPQVNQLTDEVPPIETNSTFSSSTTSIDPVPPTQFNPMDTTPTEPVYQAPTPQPNPIVNEVVAEPSFSSTQPIIQNPVSTTSNQDLINRAVEEINQASTTNVEDEAVNLPPSMNNPLGGQRTIHPISNISEPKIDINTLDNSTTPEVNKDEFDPNSVAL